MMAGACEAAAVRPIVAPRARRIALYPGAFRPAHKVHLAAILGLAARPEIDEVVVIIANRCRVLPGTTLALDAEVARAVLSIYLRGVAKVRVEVAPHNAVTHALGFLDRAAAGDTLLYCVGEADLDGGDDRFADLLAATQRRQGVQAEVLALPTGAGTVRATALREALALGEARREEFIAALPDQLSDDEGERVWSICRDGLRELDDIVEDKLRRLLDPALVGDAPALRCVVPGKLDPVFALRRGDGTRLYIKYAGETAEAGSVGRPLQAKPRRRLSAERRAIKCLRAHLPGNVVELAEIVAFDKALSLLVLGEVCRGGESWQEQMRAGRFDPRVGARVGRLLGACHGLAAEVPALWGEAETDLRHWQAMLELRTSGSAAARLSPRQQQALSRLRTTSEAARRKGFFLLDATPKNILVKDDVIGLIDLELCSSQGDPAYDLGLLLGHVLLWGLRSGRGPAALATVGAVVQAYRQHVGGQAWAALRARVPAFAGAALLDAIARERRIDIPACEAPLTAAAASLLDSAGAADTMQSFVEAAAAGTAP